MVLSFFILFFIMFIFFGIIFSKLKFIVKELEFEMNDRVKAKNNYEIKIGLYLYDKILSRYG